MDPRTEMISPLASFYCLIPDCRPPQRADRSAAGSMPTRAFRYCEAMTSASAFGWYVFPPLTFSLMWDGGTDILWTHHKADGWYQLTAAQYPGFAAHFDQAAPAECRGFSPPFLAAFKEPGLVQIWTGIMARTAPGWSLLVRPPANLARSQGCDFFEGIVEADRWFGPLFTNVRLTRTHSAVTFDAEFPLLQVQPVPHDLYGHALDDFGIVSEIERLTPDDWDAYRATIVEPNSDPHRERGQYAVGVRRRRREHE